MRLRSPTRSVQLHAECGPIDCKDTAFRLKTHLFLLLFYVTIAKQWYEQGENLCPTAFGGTGMRTFGGRKHHRWWGLA